ncbi:cell division protein ZipA [Photobacterium sp. TY1-4]|uniref:cell division protein ZipA n=1 Tax=Photobacterium sp. TY1-4 TaxID=2899122 RepID=UPI0021C0375A|nr:cell division protein ZipA [Photobacterium sp. TY1-4]UXI00616.1 cell division protein ZipA [Photobacterium sp. TY1-4]
MQELRLVLIIVGALAIAALLLHGLWSSRKEKPAKFGEKPLGKLGEESSVDADGFDQDGVGSVRVVHPDHPSREKASRKEPEFHFGDKPEADPLMAPAQPAPRTEPDRPAMTVNASAAAPETPQTAAAVQAEPAIASTNSHHSADPAVPQAMTPELMPDTTEAQVEVVVQKSVQESVQEPAQTSVLASASEAAPVSDPITAQTAEGSAAPAQTESQAEFVEVQASSEALSPTPEVDEATMTAVTSAEETVAEPVVDPDVQVEADVQAVADTADESTETLPPDYLVLNVHARRGQIIRGSALFSCLEANGLLFGENAVYHRHADPAGTGPIIYSVTNMVNPGHFPGHDDPAFETPGVAFYLMLPCPGRADNNFNQMLLTVQRVADELGADILDHERALITPHRIESYREKAKRYTRA